MILANYIAYVLTISGGINWGLVGIFDVNLVGWMFGGFRSGFAIALYVLILLSAIWLIVSPIISRGMLDLGCPYRRDAERRK